MLFHSFTVDESFEKYYVFVRILLGKKKISHVYFWSSGSSFSYFSCLQGMSTKAEKKAQKKSLSKAEVKTPKANESKAEVKTPKANEPGTSQSPKKQTVEGGVMFEELKPGNGPVAKPGKMVSIVFI